MSSRSFRAIRPRISLKDWVTAQKQKYFVNTLPKNRVARLKKLGLNLLPIRDKKFEISYAKLSKYKDEHGHCSVPPDYEDPQLARWVEIHVRIL